MNKRFEKQEIIVAKFMSALNLAGMQPTYGNDEAKPRYWRGFVPKSYSNEALFLRFNVDDNEIIYSADDCDFMQTVPIGGEIYTHNGYGDSDYQSLCKNIEEKLTENRFNIEWAQEDTDSSFNVDDPIHIKRFSVTNNIT